MLLQLNCLRSACLGAVVLLSGATRLQAESAILESVADASTPGGSASSKARELQAPGVLFFSFRTWTTFRWVVDSAELFLHVSKGAIPSGLEVAVIPNPWIETSPPEASGAFKFVAHKATDEPQGWISIKVDTKLIEEITAGKGHGLALRLKSATSIHTRETLSYRPYLIITGGRQ